MKAFAGLLILALAVAFLPTSCGKKVNCKCVGQLYAEDGSSEPATMYVEFKVWPRWVFWTESLGQMKTEMIEPAGWHKISTFKPLFDSPETEKYELLELGKTPDRLGIFSTLSGSLGFQTPHGNFVGECEHYKPIRL
jgi:hypothetical protein